MRKRTFSLKPDILFSSTLCFHDCKFIPMLTFLNGACKNQLFPGFNSWSKINYCTSDNNARTFLHETMLDSERIFIKCYSQNIDNSLVLYPFQTALCIYPTSKIMFPRLADFQIENIWAFRFQAEEGRVLGPLSGLILAV